MTLHGKAVLVTGGARRIGRAIVLEMAQAGANVVVHCLQSRGEADALSDEVRRMGVAASVVVGDLAMPAAAERIAAEAWKAFGRLDALVNNAAVFPRTPVESLTPQQWDRTLAVNLNAPAIVATQVGRWMVDAGGGAIVNLGDWSGLRPYRDYLPYCVSKAGIIALTAALAKALAPTVRVNCVAPGPVLPPDEYGETERQRLVERTPLRRLGSPEAVARMVRFLIAEADFSTGGVYLVDGGRLNA